jgi:hypothetical protein
VSRALMIILIINQISSSLSTLPTCGVGNCLAWSKCSSSCGSGTQSCNSYQTNSAVGSFSFPVCVTPKTSLSRSCSTTCNNVCNKLPYGKLITLGTNGQSNWLANVKNQAYSYGNNIIMFNDSPSVGNEQFTMISNSQSYGGQIITTVQFQTNNMCINDVKNILVLGACYQSSSTFYIFCSTCATFTRPCNNCYNVDGVNHSNGDTGPGGSGCYIANLGTRACMINSPNEKALVVSAKCNTNNNNQLWSVIPAENSIADLVLDSTSDAVLGDLMTIGDVISMFF